MVLLDAVGTVARRLRGMPPRDPRQARFVTVASIGWMIRHRAWNGFYLSRYWRLLWLRLRRPDIVLEGMFFIGRKVDIEVRKGYGRLVVGRWVHLGDENRLRVHEGTLRLGDKVVFGRDSTVNCYLDVTIGAASIVADWVYLCDFDHRYDDLTRPIKDQGIVKTPVRIDDDVWIGTKATVLRGARIGRGTVVGAHAVVRGEVPPMSVVAGVPGRVVKDRLAASAYAEAARAQVVELDARTRSRRRS